MVGKLSLQDFANAYPASASGAQAWLPGIPEFETICEAWQRNIATQKQIRDWLIQVQGYKPADCTKSRIAWLTIYMPKRPRG